MNSGLVDVRGVKYEYRTPAGGSLEVLKGVDLIVCSGEAVAIVGPSGSGKSTLLNIMGALDKPASGTVRVNGRDMAGMSESELCAVRNRDIGFVFQLHHLLPQCTVLENVLVPALPCGGASGDVQAAAREWLERVGLGDRLDYRPGQLSGGECQRVAVVRALINRPQLVLADEPTGALDRANAESLFQLLLDLNRELGTALIVVTHSSALARKTGRVLELKDGRLIES